MSPELPVDVINYCHYIILNIAKSVCVNTHTINNNNMLVIPCPQNYLCINFNISKCLLGRRYVRFITKALSWAKIQSPTILSDTILYSSISLQPTAKGLFYNLSNV